MAPVPSTIETSNANQHTKVLVQSNTVITLITDVVDEHALEVIPALILAGEIIIAKVITLEREIRTRYPS